ncbi:hypothetical protein EZJ43_10470 [Pedobacter changchengzhani]|uniref:Uncharacterized protein n=1 Tax=Pedobacter changchengzhani TaxID=2529274 RepID=A0A4R5MLI0_9SPHI|nr:hypothetical protein [Pedobacter changchengzhani]TDG36095.1 hypothetical protein EZJ43_10470 [Pedobacter changchengzhani]
MPKHNVFVDLPRRELGKIDVIFEIFQDEGKFGEIRISKGGLDYYPTNAKKPIKINWTKFDEMVKNL